MPEITSELARSAPHLVICIHTSTIDKKLSATCHPPSGRAHFGGDRRWTQSSACISRSTVRGSLRVLNFDKQWSLNQKNATKSSIVASEGHMAMCQER